MKVLTIIVVLAIVAGVWSLEAVVFRAVFNWFASGFGWPLMPFWVAILIASLVSILLAEVRGRHDL